MKSPIPKKYPKLWATGMSKQHLQVEKNRGNIWVLSLSNQWVSKPAQTECDLLTSQKGRHNSYAVVLDSVCTSQSPAPRGSDEGLEECPVSVFFFFKRYPYSAWHKLAGDRFCLDAGPAFHRHLRRRTRHFLWPAASWFSWTHLVITWTEVVNLPR